MGCDVLSLCLPETETNVFTNGSVKDINKDDLPSLLEAQDGATESIIGTRCVIIFNRFLVDTDFFTPKANMLRGHNIGLLCVESQVKSCP